MFGFGEEKIAYQISFKFCYLPTKKCAPPLNSSNINGKFKSLHVKLLCFGRTENWTKIRRFETVDQNWWYKEKEVNVNKGYLMMETKNIDKEKDIDRSMRRC